MCGPISVENCKRRNSHGRKRTSVWCKAYLKNTDVAVCSKGGQYREMLTATRSNHFCLYKRSGKCFEEYKILGGSIMTGTDFLNHNYRTLT